MTDADLQEPLGEVLRHFRSMLTDHDVCIEFYVIPDTWYPHVTAFLIGPHVLT